MSDTMKARAHEAATAALRDWYNGVGAYYSGPFAGVYLAVRRTMDEASEEIMQFQGEESRA